MNIGKTKTTSWLRKAAGILVNPVCHEPSFFVMMALLLSFSHILYLLPSDLSQVSVLHLRNVAIILSASVFMAWVLTLLVGWLKSGAFKAVLYVLAFLLMGTDLFLLFNFDTVLSPWILLLVKETNPRESTEFLGNYLLSAGSVKCYAVVAALGVAACVMEKKNLRLPLRKRWQKVLASVILMPVLFLGGYLSFWSAKLLMLRSQYDFEEWMGQQGGYAVRNTPTNLLYSLRYLSVSGHDNERAIAVCREASRQPASCSERDTLNVVLVIGESYNKYHSSLYGYPLNTTPLMGAERDSGRLFVFHDAVAPYNMTTFSLKNILSTNSLADGEPWSEKPAFPVIFKRAGFFVSMWDNQRPVEADMPVNDFALGSYMYADEMTAMSYSEYNTRTYDYDLSLVEAFRRQTSARQERQRAPWHALYVFHLMGQHSDAARRFPATEENQVFHASDIRRDDLNEAQRQAVADYDNATLYNDKVLGALFHLFRNTPTVMLYLSDHGEEVYDYRPFLGRSHERQKSREALRYQYGIPFVLWCSDRFMATHPQQVEALQRAVSRRATADDIAHLLLSLASINTPYYRNDRDILSDGYAVEKRVVQGNADYD